MSTDSDKMKIAKTPVKQKKIRSNSPLFFTTLPVLSLTVSLIVAGPVFPLNAIDNPVPKWHHVGMEHVIEEPRKRITARVSDTVRVTLEQAAELLGSTVNQFVVQTAYQEAQRVVERESVIRLSQKDARPATLAASPSVIQQFSSPAPAMSTRPTVRSLR